MSLFFSSGDEMFSDAFKYREIQDGFFYEVEGKVSHSKLS